jgi:hypothetical protein
MKLLAFLFVIALGALAVSAQDQTTVCGEAEYAVMLRKSPPTAEWMRYPIPPRARIDVQQTLIEGWPRRGFSQTIVYRFPSGTKVADVERFFVQAGVYEAHGTLFRDVNPNKWPGDSMRHVTEDDGVVTYSIHRRTTPTLGTPFGDVAWVAEQLRDHPPTAADLTAPLYPGATLDIDSSAARIVSEPGAVIDYYTSASLEQVRAFYGIPAHEFVRKISPDARLHRLSVAAYSRSNREKRTRFWIELPYQGPISHLTGPGPIVAGPPPGWNPRRWKGGCELKPIAPILPAQP